MNKQQMEDELLTLTRHEQSEKFRQQQSDNQAYYREHGRCQHDPDTSTATEKRRAANNEARLEKVARDAMAATESVAIEDFPSDEEIMAELRLPKQEDE